MAAPKPVQLSSEDIQKLKQAFMLHDYNKSSSISSRDIGSVIRSVGLKPAEGEVDEIRAEVDAAGGKCDLQMLVKLISRIVTQPDNYSGRDLSLVFGQFDTSKSNLIPLDQFRHLMTSVGEKFLDEEVDELLKCTGCLQNGMVNYDKFIKVVMGKA
ncbi:DgyrCDS5512 [Dimorphilus gyrociliatus]|uniref:DgyrCDS5512 n=1 Tax=Dimorphilus gyrociliatus TaxID=2664684 RepID=A0A7I8VPX0_9ANNE|nr:DgyrCDS5512 [Dimorphilus gyrociliatus]